MQYKLCIELSFEFLRNFENRVLVGENCVNNCSVL